MNIPRSLCQECGNYFHLDWINLYRDDVITSIETSLHIKTTGKRWDCSWEFIKKQRPRFKKLISLVALIARTCCTKCFYWSGQILSSFTSISSCETKPSESLRCTRVIPIQYLPSPSYPLTQRHTKDPSVLVHRALESHSFSTAHSSTSKGDKKREEKERGRYCHIWAI